MTEPDPVRFDVEAGVGHIRLRRPGLLNRFDGTMREDLLAILERCAADDDVRCVRIVGEPPAFSAGADLDDMIARHRDGDIEEIRRRVAVGAAVVARIRTMDVPVVAAVGGPAAGAGANLALACDIRIGSTSARFVQSFVGIGLAPDWGGFVSLVELVGRGEAAHLAMTGTPLDAERAHALGVLQLLVPDEELETASTRYCEGLAGAPRAALVAIKRGIALAGGGSASEATARFEQDTQPALFASEECMAGMEAFLQRRRA